MLRRFKSVTVAGEYNPATGQRAGAQIKNPIVKRSFIFLWFTNITGPVGGPGIGRPFLMSQLDDLATRHMYFKDIRTLER